MTSPNPHPGEFWLAYVEFVDHPGIGKARPIFVIEVKDDTCIAVATKVTSKDLKEVGSGECVPIINWNEYGLRKPSYIRVDQKLEVAYENLLNNEPLGTLPSAYLTLISEEVSDLDVLVADDDGEI